MHTENPSVEGSSALRSMDPSLYITTPPCPVIVSTDKSYSLLTAYIEVDATLLCVFDAMVASLHPTRTATEAVPRPWSNHVYHIIGECLMRAHPYLKVCIVE